MSTRIVTDSCSDLPPEVAAASGISVVPLYLNVADETHRDGVDIDADRFYELLEGAPELPTTSQPSVWDFVEVYRDLLEQGHDVVSIHVSSGLSGTVDSALLAREAMGDPSRIEIVDSRLAGGAQGLLALEAAALAREGAERPEVARLARDAVGLHHGYVLLDTLAYLARGGRIGRARALVGTTLRIRPIVSIRDGAVHPEARLRTRSRAMARLAGIVRDLAPISRLHVSYTTGRGDALGLRAALRDLVDADRIVESRLGPVLGTHLGPGAVGVAATRAGGSRGEGG